MKNLFYNLSTVLRKSSSKLNLGIKKIFSLNKPKEAILEEIEEILISSDLGVKFSTEIIDNLRKTNFDEKISIEVVYKCLRDKFHEVFKNTQSELNIAHAEGAYVMLFCGINGSGKTTSIGKIASKLTNEGKKVLIAAGDTFRAAATEQLSIWAQKSNAEIFKSEINSDPASVAYQAFKKAQDENFDVLLIDTAGRVPNNNQLMDELKKINKVVKKLDQNAPHHSFLVIDATIGQTAIKQVELFHQAINISGMIITKLDGTSKAGVIVPITQKFKLPVNFVGVGENITDLQIFSPKDFINSILNVE